MPLLIPYERSAISVFSEVNLPGTGYFGGAHGKMTPNGPDRVQCSGPTTYDIYCQQVTLIAVLDGPLSPGPIGTTAQDGT